MNYRIHCTIFPRELDIIIQSFNIFNFVFSLISTTIAVDILGLLTEIKLIWALETSR